MPLLLVEVLFEHCFVYTGYFHLTATARPLGCFSVVWNYYLAKNMTKNELRLKKQKNIKDEDVHHTRHMETEI